MNTPADLLGRITIEPGKRSGQPCIRGIRMTVKDVPEYMAGGMAEAGILEDFPDLEPEDIGACLAFAVECLPRPQSGVEASARVSELNSPLGKCKVRLRVACADCIRQRGPRRSRTRGCRW